MMKPGDLTTTLPTVNVYVSTGLLSAPDLYSASSRFTRPSPANKPSTVNVLPDASISLVTPFNQAPFAANAFDNVSNLSVPRVAPVKASAVFSVVLSSAFFSVDPPHAVKNVTESADTASNEISFDFFIK